MAGSIPRLQTAAAKMATPPLPTSATQYTPVTAHSRPTTVGLLEGAHTGVGLGHQFLRHVQRCRVLVHVLDGTSPDPLGDFHAIRTELELFSPELADKPQVRSPAISRCGAVAHAWPDSLLWAVVFLQGAGLVPGWTGLSKFLVPQIIH